MNISVAREKRGITQAELADSLCVTQGAISQWETGRSFPRAELMPKLADIHGCTVDELLRKEE